MKIRSAVPENGCLIFLVDGKKQKKHVKHIRYRLIGGCVKQSKLLEAGSLLIYVPIFTLLLNKTLNDASPIALNLPNFQHVLICISSW